MTTKRRKKPGRLYRWVRENDFTVNELIEAAELVSMPVAGY
jgi:hypothetical protein